MIWTVELVDDPEASLVRQGFLVTPGGYRVALMTAARAVGIAAALNTPEGHAAFQHARDAYNAGNS